MSAHVHVYSAQIDAAKNHRAVYRLECLDQLLVPMGQVQASEPMGTWGVLGLYLWECVLACWSGESSPNMVSFAGQLSTWQQAVALHRKHA